jgi:hypothetical protein
VGSGFVGFGFGVGSSFPAAVMLHTHVRARTRTRTRTRCLSVQDGTQLHSVAMHLAKALEYVHQVVIVMSFFSTKLVV